LGDVQKEMVRQGIMKKSDYSVSMAKAQTASLPFGLFAAVEFLLFAFRWGFEPIKEASDILLPWFFLPLFIVGITVHELIHGLSWMLAGILPAGKIKFGFQLKTLTPYAHCTVPLKKHAYVFGTVMPAVLLGFIPFIISFVTGSGRLLIFGIIFTFAAIGDFLIVWLIRSVSWTALVEDHPENAGCFVYVSETADSTIKLKS
jgi:hypothetical protein